MKKVLVIGSNSFSGAHFIDFLLEQGGYNILGVSRSPEKSSLFLPYKQWNSSFFQFKQIDLNKDLEEFKKLFAIFLPDYVVNFAAQSEVAPSWENPHHWFQTNAVALTNLANFLKDQKCIQKYVHISSPEVYGTCEGSVKEDAPLNPTTPYAASKAAGDLSLFTFYKNFNFPLVMIRATNVYGACQQLFKIIPRSFLYIKSRKVIELHGGGEAIKSYIHIRDVSQGEKMVMEQGVVGEIYHLSPDQGIQVKEVVSQICGLQKVSFAEAVRTVSERLGQDKAYTIDSSKARRLGWRPEVSFSEGLRETSSWIDRNFEALSRLPQQYIHQP